MRIKPQYFISYEEEEMYVMERLPDGTERDVCPISPTAAMVWDGIEHSMSRGTIIESVAAEFSADPELVSADLDALFAQLVAMGYAEE